MAAVTITAANLQIGANARVVRGIAGENSVARGEVVYRDTSDNNRWKALANTVSATIQPGDIGIALNDVDDEQDFLIVVEDDDLTIGGTLVANTCYFAGAAGVIEPHADLTAADYGFFLGVAKSTTKLIFKPIQTGAQVAA